MSTDRTDTEETAMPTPPARANGGPVRGDWPVIHTDCPYPVRQDLGYDFVVDVDGTTYDGASIEGQAALARYLSKPQPASVIYLPDLIRDPAQIRATADERDPEPVDAPGVVAVRLQAELDESRLHLLRRTKAHTATIARAVAAEDALARVTRENEALRAKVAAVEALVAEWKSGRTPVNHRGYRAAVSAALATAGEGK